MHNPIAYLDWSLHVECDSCGKESDISRQDDDGFIVNAIFTNNWGIINGLGVRCDHCGQKLVINRVVY